MASKQRLTRLQTFSVEGTDDRVDFLSRIDGYSTAVLIAKDVCSNVPLVGFFHSQLDTSATVTDNVKYGIDYLLSQIIAFYRRFYTAPVAPSLQPSPSRPLLYRSSASMW